MLNREKNWSIDYDTAPGELSFKHNDVEFLKSTGVELGILLEKYAYEEKNRLHESTKNDSFWVETETKHPFGAEPVIKHKYEVAGNHVRVTTDIQISHTLPVENILIDKLNMPGDWDTLDLYQFEEAMPYKISKKTYKIDSFEDLKFDTIPLIIVLNKRDGSQLEIGSGFDLWRWDIADKHEAVSEFILKKDADGINFIRKPAVWNEEYELQRRNFRFSWYFAWGKKEKDKENIKNVNMLSFDKNKLKQGSDYDSSIHDFIIDDKSILENIEKDSSKDICFCSRAFFNMFKHWLRVLYNEDNSGKYTITLNNVKSGICSKTSHVAGKSKKKKQIHFDYLYLFGIWEWANQHLGDSDINFSIKLDKTNLLSELPSAVGLNSRQVTST